MEIKKMRKTLSILIALAITFAMFTAVAAQHTPAPGGPFNSAFRVQNLDTTTALCGYKFYDENGVVGYETTTDVSVEPGDSLYVYVPNLGDDLDPGSYSGLVTCDKVVAAVSNFSDADSGASHSAISDPGTTWYAPGIYDDYYDYYSNVVVQNATPAAVDITIEIFEPGNTTPVFTDTEEDVPGYAAVSFEQEGLTQLVQDQFYSAVIEGTGDIAPIVNIYGGAGSSVDNQLYSYNPFRAGSTTAYAPVIMNDYYGYDTALVIQNIDTASADVTVTYTDGTTADYTIGPGAAQSIHTPTASGLPAGNTLYGATVESTNGRNIVVLVNESNDYNRAASYSGFPGGSQEVRAPIVMKRYYDYNTSVTCQNLGTSATTMTIVYSEEPTAGSTSPSIDVGDTHLFYQPSETLPDDYIGSATITANQNIVCVVNEDMNEPPRQTEIMDQLYAYNGIEGQ
jgi:hypothetical protein